MISVDEASKIILSHTKDYGIESISLPEAYGRILREPIHADRPLPPYDRVTMDGICLAFSAYEAGQRSFRVHGVVPAGTPQASLNDPKGCLQIMTGAVLAKGADTVVRYEDVEFLDGNAFLKAETVKRGQNVHAKGSDRVDGELLIDVGRSLGAAEVNVLATVGKSVLDVSKLPKIVLISTGDELVRVDEKPEAHQIRRSNTTALFTLLYQYGGQVDVKHLTDDKSLLKEKINNYIEEYDVLIISGGVSKGKFDYVPEVLDFLGVNKLFHKVAQRPGKPFWFGVHPAGTIVFALPGNPVSSFVCTFRYFVPWLRSSLKVDSQSKYARLKSPIHFSKDLTYFAQVKLINENGELQAIPVQGNGSGDLANMVDADAFMELPTGKNIFNAGEAYPIYPFNSLFGQSVA